MTSGIHIRRLKGDDDFIAATRTFRTAMLGLPDPGPLDAAFVARTFEPGRTFGAFEGDNLVGTVNSYSGWLAVPGGARVRQAAVTHVGVAPTHTRRGILSRLIAAQLADIRAAGEVVANLRASDARIYGRFGYAVAGRSARIVVERERARLRQGAEGRGAVRLLPAADAFDIIAAVYERVAGRTRPGAIARSPYWWTLNRGFLQRAGGPAYVALYGAPGREEGFARYHPVGHDTWFTGRERTVIVSDLVAATPQAHSGLVSFLLSLDLPHRLVFASLPEDDALPWLLEDSRAATVEAVGDETWLRLTDVAGALSGRRFGAGEPVILAVKDALLPDNDGLYRVASDGVQRLASGAAEAVVDIATLSAVYLGGVRWWQLAAAGRVTGADADTIARLDRLFASERQPHSGTIF